ncbi:MAG: hypothetical protein JJT89_10985, partial [Nitriliruptoraceae bacterium]|nr:hypothetical protein [Nitriliruptoraceae bacterium]
MVGPTDTRCHAQGRENDEGPPPGGHGGHAAYTYLRDAGDPDEPLEIAIQRIDGPVRHHLDVVAPDVD